MIPPVVRTVPPTTLRPASPATDRRARRAAQESAAALREYADHHAKYAPALVAGLDGNTYEVEAIRARASGSLGRAPWSVAFVGSGINMAIPYCVFTTLDANPPPFLINGRPVDYVDLTNNVLPLPAGVSHLFLELDVDDKVTTGLNTTRVKVVALSAPDNANTLTRRYIPILSVNATTKVTGVPSLTRAIQTFRRGDRENVSNLVVLPF